jgi:hypothetical protein
VSWTLTDSALAENWIEGLPANFKTLGTNLQFKKRTGLQKRIGQIDLIAKLEKFTGLKKRKVDQNAIIKD